MPNARHAARAGHSSFRHRTAVLLACTAISALLPALATAQDATTSEDDSTVLQTITVEGKGQSDADSKTVVATESTAVGKMPGEILTTPATVSVITSKEVEQRAADSVEKVVQYTAGVITDYYGSDDRYDYVKIRGFTPYTYRDGLAIGRTWSGVKEEPYAFERLEVLKGANSTGYGVSDPGGAINYVTKTPRSEKFGEVYGMTGSFAHKEAGFDFGDNLTEDDTLSYRLTGKVQRADEEYDFSENDENFIQGGLTWRPTDVTSMTFVFDHLDRDGTPSGGGHPLYTDFDRDRFFGEPEYNYNTTNRNTFTVMFDHDFGDGLTFNSNARYVKSKTGFGYAYIYDSVGASDPSDTLADRYYFQSENSAEQFVIDAHLLYETHFDNIESRTLVGVDSNNSESEGVLYYALAPQIDWSSPVYSGGPGALLPYDSSHLDQDTKALYLQQDLIFSDRLTASVGLRNDWMDLEDTDLLSGTSESGSYSELSKRLGLSYKITEELAAYVSYAESVAPPSAGNEPTYGSQYEAGIKYRPDAFPGLLTASIYDLTLENITTYDAPLYVASTVDKIRHRGLDLEAKVEVTSNIEMIAGYSYIDSKIVDTDTSSTSIDGNRFAQVPEHMASLWATYTLDGDGARGDMTFGAGARYIGSYYFDNANTRKSDGTVIFDASFTYAIKENTSFQLNVSNVFDEKHIANNDGGAYYYNPGRTVYATIRQTW
ncbi:ligand-gated channel [Rhizobium sp. Root274]|uniref:TonB-dependent siderophore receptor n=1 Tax=unclassified Rhizobium TaxID=2613769 RepID=UPI000713C082|nr:MULTISPECIES: TonB-dependent siderophore receptor [unclassified Rhizobium]KQW27914.1 ligand-gated channel [Rhizobium sp. Root1240]KRD28194.1 ligand-gated channel [Rhizobium sp. Root274]